LFWLLASRIDVTQAADLVSSSLSWSLLAGILMLAATIPINGLRWRAILSNRNKFPSTFNLLKIIFVGLFFNQVLPTGIGGDAVRAWRCQKLGIHLGTAIRSILIERASGYFVLVVLYASGLPFLLRAMSGASEKRIILAVLITAIAALASLFVLDWLLSFAARRPIIALLTDLSRDARRLCSELSRLAMVLFLSGLGIGLTALSFKFLGDSVSVELSYPNWLIIIPPVALISLLPVSLAGWGVREATLVVVLAGFGVPNENALATSLLFGLCQIVIAVPGGLIWLTGWDLEHPDKGRVATAAFVKSIDAISVSNLTSGERGS
jgi:uncharacterized membrane protein YbhN (UPF0104 family)